MRRISEIRRENARALRDQAGSNKAFAESVGVEPPAASRVLSARATRNIGDEFARRIEQAFQKEDGWLDSRHEIQQPERTADETNVTAFPSRASREYAADRAEENLETPPQLSGKAPLLSWVQAGAWTDTISSMIDDMDQEFYPRPPNCGPDTFVLRVRGESMMEVYPAGTLIFVDPDIQAMSGDDVIVQCEEHGGAEATFKRYIEEPGQPPMLKALNRAWAQQYIPLSPQCRIIGVVMAQMMLRR